MKLDDIKKVGVLGGGVMGGGIAQCLILAGFNVMIRDLSDEINEKSKNAIVNGPFGIKSAVDRGKTTAEEMDAAIKRLSYTTKPEDLADVDLLIEAIGGGEGGRLEDKPLKLRIFGDMDKIVKKSAVFASNTSFFTIADLAAVTGRKDLFVGMHLFSPAPVMKLVEVVSTADTRPEVTELIEALALKMGKTPVRVKDVPGDTGFIANRVYGATRREAMKIVQEGVATAEDVDTAMMLGFRWPVGPISMGMGARSGWKKK